MTPPHDLVPTSSDDLPAHGALEKVGQVADEHAARGVFTDYLSRKADNTIRCQVADLARFADYLDAIGEQAGLDLGASMHDFAGAVAAFPDGLMPDAAAWRGATWGLVEGFRNWMVAQGDAVGSINVRLSTVKAYAKLAAKAGALTAEQHAMIRTVEGYSQKEGKRVDERRETAPRHGLDRDNFIGPLPQRNTPTARWDEFYRDQRIAPQVALARQRGRLPRRREDLLTRLLARLPALLDGDTPASLLHGDLWGGNYLVDERGAAVLIDPAVYYGHREMDLAMSELFGGFSERFYAAYQAAYPTPGYPERRALYQLYYLLVHLNLFGESYGGRVDSIAAHYVGW